MPGLFAPDCRCIRLSSLRIGFTSFMSSIPWQSNATPENMLLHQRLRSSCTEACADVQPLLAWPQRLQSGSRRMLYVVHALPNEAPAVVALESILFVSSKCTAPTKIRPLAHSLTEKSVLGRHCRSPHLFRCRVRTMQDLALHSVFCLLSNGRLNVHSPVCSVILRVLTPGDQYAPFAQLPPPAGLVGPVLSPRSPGSGCFECKISDVLEFVSGARSDPIVLPHEPQKSSGPAELRPTGPGDSQTLSAEPNATASQGSAD